MIAEALKYLNDQFKPKIVDVFGKQFSNETFTEIKPAEKILPLPGEITVSTLAALADLLRFNFEGCLNGNRAQPIIHIVNYKEVKLMTAACDEHGRRTAYAKSALGEYTGFKFDHYQPIDPFIVGIQSHFLQTTDLDYLVLISSRIIDEAILVSEDDGISQQASVKAGLSLKGSEKLRSRVSLCPFRTFREADQPASDFIFRARKGQNGTELALFQADGGKWQITAMENIAYKLRDLGITVPIIT